MLPRKARRDPLPSRQSVRAWLEGRFLLRIHMSLILGGTFLTGLATTSVLLLAGVGPLALRYGIAVLAAYLGFLLLIRLWLMYVRIGGIDFSADGIENAVEFASGSSDSSVSGGGHFGGGGASGSWEGPPPVAQAVKGSSLRGGGSSGGGKSSSGFSFDFDADEGVVIIVFIALVAALLFAGVYLIYTAPAILSEALFEALLAGALLRRAQKVDSAGWIGAVWRATVWPFLAILVLAVALGWVANRECPEATRLRDAFNCPTKGVPIDAAAARE